MTSNPSLSSELIRRVGHTSFFRLSRSSPNPMVTIYAKMECHNPSGSIKDRAISHIFSCEERKGRLTGYRQSLIASRGSGALSLALFSRNFGIDPTIFAPDSISPSKMELLKKLGATLFLSPAHLPFSSDQHYIQQAARYFQENPEIFSIHIHDNYRNPEAYYLTLGPEIWGATEGKIDYLISGGSTGGAISGTSRFLKEKNREIKTVLADPHGSLFGYFFEKGRLPEASQESLLSDIPIPVYLGKAIDFDVIDEVASISVDEAACAQKILLCQEGLIVGFGSALAMAAAFKLAIQLKKSATIVALMRDSYFP